MRINHNIAALNTHRQLNTAAAGQSKSMEKLSSGLRINRAGDDAAGLAISEKMRAQVRGLDMAAKNAQDGISMIQTAEGALNETHSILQRMRELATQAASDTNTVDDRGELQKEINQLTSEINRIGNTTEFNTKKLLNGDLASVVSGSTTTTTTKVKDDTYAPVFANGVTWTGLAGETPKITDGTNDNRVKFAASTIDAGNPFSWDIKTSGGTTNKLEISRSGNDLLVSISATDTDGDVLTVTNQKMAFDEVTNKYKYDANGVTFDLSKAEFDKFTDGAKIAIDLNEYDPTGGGNVDLKAATVGTKADYTQTLKGGGSTFGTFATGIEVDSTDANYIEGVVGIKITGTDLDVAAGTLQIELLDAAGASIVTEKIAGAAASGNLSYDAHGISFTYTLNDTSDLNLEMDFDTVTKNQVATTTTDKSATFQIGANAGQSMSVGFSDMRSLSLGISSGTVSDTKTVKNSMGQDITAVFTATKDVNNGTNNAGAEYALDISTSKNASAAIAVLDGAMAAVSAERSKLGSYQNRLEHTINNLGTSSENLTAAESRIRDVDMAKEMMEQTKNSILSQAAQAMLAQANQQPQGVLQLLR